MNLEVLKGDITNVAADAIVLPANRHLKEGSGASASIFMAAGRTQLTDACNRIGYCEVGNAVATPAFRLKANYIIHAAVPKWKGGDNHEYDLLSSAYLSALFIADAMDCKQIAFPLLASGNNGFNRQAALEIAVRSIKTFKAHNLQNAYLVLYGDRVASLAESYGYHVLVLPSKPAIQRDMQHYQNMQKIAGDYVKAGQDFIENELQKGARWLDDPVNQQKIEKAGKIVATAALAYVFKDANLLKEALDKK